MSRKAAELARPYARKTRSTPIRNYQDRKRNPNWDKSSRKSSVSSIHPLPRSAPQQADSPYNHADFTMTPASGYTSPRSRYTEMKHDDDSHSLCHSTASNVKNSPKPLLSLSTDTKQVATSTSSLAAPPPPPPPPPPPLPSTNYSVPRKTAPIRGTPVKVCYSHSDASNSGFNPIFFSSLKHHQRKTRLHLCVTCDVF